MPFEFSCQIELKLNEIESKLNQTIKQFINHSLAPGPSRLS